MCLMFSKSSKYNVTSTIVCTSLKIKLTQLLVRNITTDLARLRSLELRNSFFKWPSILVFNSSSSWLFLQALFKYFSVSMNLLTWDILFSCSNQINWKFNSNHTLGIVKKLFNYILTFCNLIISSNNLIVVFKILSKIWYKR